MRVTARIQWNWLWFTSLSHLYQKKIGESKYTVNFLKLVDDHDIFECHDWGAIKFARMVNGLKRALDMQHIKGRSKVIESKCSIVGFSHTLQEWHYISYIVCLWIVQYYAIEFVYYSQIFLFDEFTFWYVLKGDFDFRFLGILCFNLKLGFYLVHEKMRVN